MNLQNLSSQDYKQLFSDIIDQTISPAQTRDILIQLNKAPYSQESFIGAVSALKERMVNINAPHGAIDVCGTGGDKLNTLNVSTAVCFVVAAAGVPVAKHGNKAVSSLSGSADIFTELGVKTLSDVAEIEQTLAEKNLCFLFAPFFHASLKNLAQIRKDFAQEFGQPTIFNYLGPLLNPANTKLQLIGTSRRDSMKNMLGVAAGEILKQVQDDDGGVKDDDGGQNAGKRIYIVHGFDGMDEVTLCDDSYLLRFEDGRFFEEDVINPEKFGFAKVGIDAIKGADAKHNAQQLLALLQGEKSAYRDIVVLNTAFALKVAGKVQTVEDGVDMAQAMIDEGLALKVLNNLIKG